MKVNIEKLDHFGRGITRINNKICFVENALENEIIEIDIIKEKSKYIEAVSVSTENKSDDRNKDMCPYYDKCGGCNLEHMSFKKENEFKTNKVKDLIKRYSGLDNNEVNDVIFDKEYNYRNKIVLHVKEDKLGFYQKNSNDLIEIDECRLSNNKINKLIKILKEFIKTNQVNEITIRTSNNENNISMEIIGKVNNYNELLKNVDVLKINEEIITKEKYLNTQIGDINYKVSINSFFQINPEITKKIYDKVKDEIIKTKSKNILDLYCGAGTISIYCKDAVEEIIGVDYNKKSIENANINKELNNVKNAKYICDKVENVIDSFKNNIDTIIVDPPRAGLDEKTRNYLKIINPKNIIYISCDQVTLARDLKELKDNYIINEITPYNMFPRTYHCETICVLERR